MSYKAVEEISRSNSEELNIFILQGGAECLKTCISNITQLKDVAPELSSNTHGTTQIRIMELGENKNVVLDKIESYLDSEP